MNWMFFVVGGCLGIFLATVLLTWAFLFQNRENERKEYEVIFKEIEQIKGEIRNMEMDGETR